MVGSCSVDPWSVSRWKIKIVSVLICVFWFLKLKYKEVNIMMVHHPSSSTEMSAVDTVGAVVHASQTTPSRTEAAKEKETLKSLVDVLQQVTRNVPTQGTPAQRSGVTPTLNDTIDARWLKVYRKHAKRQKNLENVAMTRKPTPSTTPAVLTLQTDPDISV